MKSIKIKGDDLNDEEMMKLKKSVVDYFKEQLMVIQGPENAKFRLKSVLIEGHDGISNAASGDAPLETLCGDPELFEILNGLKFLISPKSFFQVNTEMAEV